MKKSDFESLPIPHALTFIAEQAGVKWDAEGMEELPPMMVYGSGGDEYSVRTATIKMTYEQAREAVRLLGLIPRIRELSSIERVAGVVPHNGRLTSIASLLAGAKP